MICSSQTPGWLWLLVPLSRGCFQIFTSPSSIIYWRFKMCTDNSNLPCFTDYFIMPLSRTMALYFTNEVKTKKYMNWSAMIQPWFSLELEIGFCQRQLCPSFSSRVPTPSPRQALPYLSSCKWRPHLIYPHKTKSWWVRFSRYTHLIGSCIFFLHFLHLAQSGDTSRYCNLHDPWAKMYPWAWDVCSPQSQL